MYCMYIAYLRLNSRICSRNLNDSTHEKSRSVNGNFSFSPNGPALSGNNATVKLLNNSTKTFIHLNESIALCIKYFNYQVREGSCTIIQDVRNIIVLSKIFHYAITLSRNFDILCTCIFLLILLKHHIYF